MTGESSQAIRRTARVQSCVAFAALLLTGACAIGSTPASVPGSAVAAAPRVATGLDRVLADPPAVLRDRRVGLITNHTGVDATGRSAIDLLHADPRVRLVALFSPEHGITGRAPPGERVGDDIDPRSGLPIRSLYGETRKPTMQMLEDVDVLVFDIQDIGTRFYTYVWTMTLAMEAAAERRIPFVVLDRPNPIGGVAVQGNVLDPSFATFVGLHAVPMRHGMTAGEIARMVNAEHAVGADLTVVPMTGWTRSMWFDSTGLPWLPPSPNMPDLASAAHYPGTCLFEGTNLSVGRGTDRPFQQVGAPWLDAPELAARMNAKLLPGVRFEAVTFTPRNAGDGKFNGVPVRGVRFVLTDRGVYDPSRASIEVLAEIRAMHGDTMEFLVAHFDRLAGTDRVRHMLLDGEPAARITATWDVELSAWNEVRRRYLLYP